MRFSILRALLFSSIAVIVGLSVAHPAYATTAPAFSPRVNAGSGMFNSASGDVWAADANFSGGYAVSTSAAIAGTGDQTLYRTTRQGKFHYVFSVLNGGYVVTLKFADINWSRPGQRVFNVTINGQIVLSAFDIAAQVGRDRALDETFAVSATGGRLDIAFAGVKRAATVSAIQVLATASPTATATATASLPAPGSSYLFGTLHAGSSHASQEYAAGVRVATLDLGWDVAEPQDGTFDANYLASAEQQVQAFRSAGMQVELSVGLQYPPSWIYTYAGSQFLDQYGDAVQGGFVNHVFSQTVRNKAAEFMTKLVQAIGPQNLWTVRVGTSNYGEVGYPSETSAAGHANEYWAFDSNAQGTGGDLPGTLSPVPFPGWQPGNATYNGQRFTAGEAQQWYAWYYTALADDLNWQIATYRNAGFTGQIQVVMAGLGARPDDEAGAYNVLLNGTGGDSDGAMGVGASYPRILPEIVNKQNVVIDISSVDDSSSAVHRNDPGGDGSICQPSDAQVVLSDPQMDNWPSVRWLSYNARANGLPTIGENPDDSTTTPAYGVQMMQDSSRYMAACGLTGLLWAHDGDLYDGQHGVTLSDYATVIAQYNH